MTGFARSRLMALTAFFTMLSGQLNAQDALKGWLCVAERASGFRYNKANKTWQPESFQTDKRYIIRPPSDTDIKRLQLYGREAPAFVVLELGKAVDSLNPYQCPRPPAD